MVVSEVTRRFSVTQAEDAFPALHHDARRVRDPPGQQARTVGSQSSADIEQGLTQAVPRLLFTPVGPEQGGELCAGAGVPARQGQEGLEGNALFRAAVTIA
jgi:hypothetical protein